jgi:DNA polymerase-3 subunit epsilon
VVDVETTGFDPHEDRIVEVGVVVLDPAGGEVGSFRSLVDPGRDPGPTHIHGITPAMVAGAPTFAGIGRSLAGLMTGRVVVGHNVDRFDLAFLRAEWLRCGGGDAVPEPLVTVDTLRVAQWFLALRGRATLADSCAHYGLTWHDHHSALGDARVTAVLFRCMRQQLGDDLLGVELALARAAQAGTRCGPPPDAVPG